MIILDSKQINQKLKRMAIEIIENNFDEEEIYLLGINNNGLKFAKILASYLRNITEQKINISNLRLNPAEPVKGDISITMDVNSLENKVLILVDDVANTGRTMFYAFKPLLNILAKKIELAVLVNRKHKSFPAIPNYIGLSLATTVQENIKVNLSSAKEREVSLE